MADARIAAALAAGGTRVSDRGPSLPDPRRPRGQRGVRLYLAIATERHGQPTGRRPMTTPNIPSRRVRERRESALRSEDRLDPQRGRPEQEALPLPRPFT